MLLGARLDQGNSKEISSDLPQDVLADLGMAGVPHFE